MAQIDHEEGNQSVLGEVLAHIIIPPPLEKKKQVSARHGVRVERPRGEWGGGRHKGILKQADSLSFIVLTTIFSLPRPNELVTASVI